MRALAFGLMIVLGGPASAVEPLNGATVQPNPQVQRSLQAAQQQAIENRLERRIYQAEQRLIRELDRRAVQPPPDLRVPEFAPSCRSPIRGTASVPLRCR